MNIVQVTLYEWRVLSTCLGHCIVYIDGKWLKSQQATNRNKVLNILSTNKLGIDTIYYLCTNGSDDIEDYIVDELKVTNLPSFLYYKMGKFSHYITDVADIRNIEYSSQCKDYETNSINQNIINYLFNNNYTKYIGRIFISGDKASVGKSTISLAILLCLINLGVNPNDIAYIKPVTQCEKEQPVTRYCNRVGISNRSIGPVVFYKGFTRAYLAGETESSYELLNNIQKAVNSISINKRLTIIDGVGYPSVGSICSISNANVAKCLHSPVILVGKAGVGDAVDSHNLNSTYFESHGVRVLGAIFNKQLLDGFYSLESCRESITSYFNQYKSYQKPYGFIPLLNVTVAEDNNDQNTQLLLEQAITNAFLQYGSIQQLLFDIWVTNLKETNSIIITDTVMNTPMDITSSTTTTTTIIPPPTVTTLPSNVKKRTREEIEEISISKGAKKGG